MNNLKFLSILFTLFSTAHSLDKDKKKIQDKIKNFVRARERELKRGY